MNNTELLLVIIASISSMVICVIFGMHIHSNRVYQTCLDKNSHAPYVIIHEVCKELALK